MLIYLFFIELQKLPFAPSLPVRIGESGLGIGSPSGALSGREQVRHFGRP